MGGECGFSFKAEVQHTVPISRHGFKAIALTTVACAVIAGLTAPLFGWGGLLFMLGIVPVAAFFRDPERYAEDNRENAILAPADGRIVAVEEATMPVSGRKAMMVDIFLSVFNVHINRAPLDGTVSDIQYKKGKFLNALKYKAGSENENNVIALESPEGRHVEVKQISGAIARRIVCSASSGDEVFAGQRIGMIKFGSRTQLFVPADRNVSFCIKAGDKVKAGESVLIE